MRRSFGTANRFPAAVNPTKVARTGTRAQTAKPLSSAAASGRFMPYRPNRQAAIASLAGWMDGSDACLTAGPSAAIGNGQPWPSRRRTDVRHCAYPLACPSSAYLVAMAESMVPQAISQRRAASSRRPSRRGRSRAQEEQRSPAHTGCSTAPAARQRRPRAPAGPARASTAARPRAASGIGPSGQASKTTNLATSAPPQAARLIP
jgi:hypothetical protein